MLTTGRARKGTIRVSVIQGVTSSAFTNTFILEVTARSTEQMLRAR
jgi:hypothetical protein